jgi:predicted nucleic acid-binding protein
VRSGPALCVVDASAILPVVDIERYTDRAERWLIEVQPAGAQVVTVDLFDAECANAVWKRVRREQWAPRRAEQALSFVLALPFRRLPLREVVEDALVLGMTYGLSVYDACYVALAVVSGLPLVTADRRLATVARQAGCEVVCFAEEG